MTVCSGAAALSASGTFSAGRKLTWSQLRLSFHVTKAELTLPAKATAADGRMRLRREATGDDNGTRNPPAGA